MPPKYYDEIPESLFKWILKQKMFFVATAPLNERGHVNVSPKGTDDSFHMVNSKQVWYDDLSGSGVETISHIRENGRIVIMFCAFEGPPKVLRFWGVGTVHEYGSLEYNRLIPLTSRKPGSRSIIFIDVYRVGTSCGSGVPLYDFVMQRTELLSANHRYEQVDRALAAAASCDQLVDQVDDHALSIKDVIVRKETGTLGFSLRKYWLLKNQHSMDGLRGLLTAPNAILKMMPQNNYNKEGPRPVPPTPPHASSREIGGHASEDSKWFTLGFVLGIVAMFGVAMIVDSLKGWKTGPHRIRPL